MATTVWKGQLTFGLVSVPVRLFRAARRARISLHYLQEDTELPKQKGPEPIHNARRGTGPAFILERPELSVSPGAAAQPVARVQQAFTPQRAPLEPGAGDEQPVARDRLLKGFEVAPGQYVTFRAEELRRIRVPTSQEMQIIRSVHLTEIDPVYFDASYYVVPDRDSDHAYTLLFTALNQTGLVALAKVAMHGREHVMVVRPGKKGLLAHTIYYSDEIRAEDEFQAETTAIPAKELELAKAFVMAIAGPFAPEEVKDLYCENLQAAISEKKQRKEIRQSRPAGEPAKPQPEKAPVIDIMQALRKSLELAKQPTAKQPERRVPGKATEIGTQTPMRKGSRR